MAFTRGEPDELGWRPLIEIPAAEHVGESFPAESIPLLLLHHLSDLHVCDAQSPIRPEFLDRWSDPDSPIRAEVGTIGTYRPHSMLSVQVVESMVQALNQQKYGPLSGHAMQGAIITGDTTDNAQLNEVDWYIRLLDGQYVEPDSGDRSRYEGVIDDGAEHYDTKYWHPHGTPAGCEDDEPRSKYGFPEIPGLLDSCRAGFKATGLNVPWFAVHGNHDALLQGTVAPDPNTQREMVGGKRYESLPSTMTLGEALFKFGEVGPAGYPEAGDARFVEVSADPDRRAVERGEYAKMHLASPGLPHGHGFSESNVRERTLYYATFVGGVKLIVMDSVNHFGGWQGSFDQEQFAWIEKEISTSDRPVVLASHHPLGNMFNDYAPSGRRVCTAEIEEMLVKYPQVILWLAGHEHRHHVEWVGPEEGVHGFWHVETSSHIDWPQQSRTVEVVRDASGDIFIGMTVVDHAAGVEYGEAKTPLEIAALSRTISANSWQKREELGAPAPLSWMEGIESDRNVVLAIRRSQ